MSSNKAKYCEIWLSTQNGKFRVSSRLPDDVVLPSDFLCAIPQGEEARVCVSNWFSTIHEARDRAVQLNDDLRRQGCKVLFFFELRLPLIGDLHAHN
jgi:hypothetical protein